MKLRILNNSLRLRLSRSEVTTIKNSGSVEAMIQFGPAAHNQFKYRLEISDKSKSIEASLSQQIISVTIPKSIAEVWTNTDQVGLLAEQKINENQTLTILIEKDFFCLKPRMHQSEDESDLYPNPNETCGVAK